MAKVKDVIRIVSVDDAGKEITIEAPVRPLSLKVLAEVEQFRKRYTDIAQMAGVIMGMAEAGYNEEDEAMQPFKVLIGMIEKGGLTQEQVVALLRKDMSESVMENARASVGLLRTLMVRTQLSTKEKELIDSEIDADFWQNADLEGIRAQAEELFRRYQ